jgi:hypothetical protein
MRAIYFELLLLLVASIGMVVGILPGQAVAPR